MIQILYHRTRRPLNRWVAYHRDDRGCVTAAVGWTKMRARRRLLFALDAAEEAMS